MSPSTTTTAGADARANIRECAPACNFDPHLGVIGVQF